MSSQFRYGMKKVLVCATRNRHKLEELRPLLEPLGYVLRTLDEEAPNLPLIEDGDTFAANAEKKALAVHQATGKAALADDSGLEVEALGGAPGVRSARFGGEPRGDDRNNRALVAALQHVPPPWPARFRCALALARPGAPTVIEEGTLEGAIVAAPRGRHGFGYDPHFLVEGSDRTLGEHAPEEKSRLSHRARAFARLRPHLARLAG